MQIQNSYGNSKLLVSILCITYNHEKYISYAIESFLLQKTNFEYEIIICDDNSTDNNNEIISNYKSSYNSKIKIIRSNTNIGAQNNFIRGYKTCKGKYIALCEGDDYWTDPLKLQKQVDFLEANPDYGLVHGDVNHLYQSTGKMIKAYNRTNKIKIPDGEIFNDLMMPGHFIKTMTVCFRRDLFETYYLKNEEIMQADWRLIDISIWLMLAKHSKIHYSDEVFATYRLLNESMSRTNDAMKRYKFHLKIHAIRDFYMRKYGCSDQISRRLDVSKYKMLLSDGFNTDNIIISQEGYLWLRNNRLLSVKERLLFWAIKYSSIKYLIKLIAFK